MSTLKQYSGLMLGLPALAGLALVQGGDVQAQGDDCFKRCGCSQTLDSGTRSSTCIAQTCSWTTCSSSVHWQCGYSDLGNDQCGAVPLCSLTDCSGGASWGS